MILTDKGGDYAVAPVGTHRALCVSIIDVGTQQGEYQGRQTLKRQVIIGWELPDELIPEGHGDATGKPFFISKFYTASLNEKSSLRKDLANWRGRDFTASELAGFDVRNILGKGCMISVTHNEKKKAKVTGVASLPKALREMPKPVNAERYFSLDAFDKAVFDSLPEGIQKIIKLSPEYQAAVGNAPVEDEVEPLPDGVTDDFDANAPSNQAPF